MMRDSSPETAEESTTTEPEFYLPATIRSKDSAVERLVSRVFRRRGRIGWDRIRDQR